MPPKQFSARLEEKTIHNERYAQLAFELIEPHRLEFLPGQYVSIQVTERGDRRSYSICSNPEIDHGFELLVDVQPGGLGSSYLNSLEIGSTISGLAPLGQFVLAEDTPAAQSAEAALAFIATGSGIAPLNSMILNLLQTRHDQRPITLYWGMRHAEHLFWLQEYQILADSFSNFSFYPVLSQPAPEWTLSSGHVTDLLAAHQFQPTTGFYLCGNKKMIEACSQTLLAKSITPEYIHHEKFY